MFKLSDAAITQLKILHAIETGECGDTSRIEEVVQAFRYRASDIILTELLTQLKYDNSIPKVHHVGKLKDMNGGGLR